MTNQTAGLEHIKEIAAEKFETRTQKGTVAEGIQEVVNAYYESNFPELIEDLVAEAEVEALIQTATKAVKAETERYSYAALGMDATGLDIVKHVKDLNRDINIELYKSTNLEGIQSLETESNLLVISSVLDALSPNDEATEAHKEIEESYLEGLEVIDDAGELDPDHEAAALSKLNSAYAKALQYLVQKNYDKSVNTMVATQETLEDELDF